MRQRPSPLRDLADKIDAVRRSHPAGALGAHIVGVCVEHLVLLAIKNEHDHEPPPRDHEPAPQLDLPDMLPPGWDRHRILSVKQAAVALDISVSHLRRLYRTKKIPEPVKIGARKLGWPAGALIDFVQQRKRSK